MADKTKIQWTDATWNFITGCSKVSQGCKNCYALRDWPRLAANPKTVYFDREFTDVAFHPERLEQPLRWAKPRRIFVNSMSDLFHDKVHGLTLVKAFAVMGLCDVMSKGHIFQILTKRPERAARVLNNEDFLTCVTIEMKQIHPGLPGENAAPWWPLRNVWLGVSVEDQETADQRIPWLLATPDAVRWVSYEPALAQVDFSKHFKRTHPGATPKDTPGLDWVVVGGESGPKARPCVIGWVRDTVRQCKAASVPVFVKQLGAKPTNREGLPHYMMDRKGGDMTEWPRDLRVREYPGEKG